MTLSLSLFTMLMNECFILIYLHAGQKAFGILTVTEAVHWTVSPDQIRKRKEEINSAYVF